MVEYVTVARMSAPANTVSRSAPWLLSSVRQQPAATQITEKFRHFNLACTLQQPLDRVNVLGASDRTYGHTGYVPTYRRARVSCIISCRCVNALSWAQGGQLLLSGGDDTTVRLWRMDQYEVDQEYPFVCRAVIRTGHRANIFNVALLPYSTKM